MTVIRFRDLLALICLVAARDRVFDAVRDVILEDPLFDAPQRGTNGRYLCYDINTVSLLVHHLRQAAYQAFNPA
jgi:hypothetical protein